MSSNNSKIPPISEAIKCVDQRVDLIGVAVETSIPKTTKGSDCYCSIRIIDETLPDGVPDGIRIRFFIPTMEKLPAVKCVGDIVVVTNVKIQTSGDGFVYAVYHKKKSTFALFEGRVSRHRVFEPYNCSPSYIVKAAHKRGIMRLRGCSLDDKIEVLHSPLLSLGEIVEGEELDFLCKILLVAEIKKNEWILFLWDGTDTPPLPLDVSLEDEMENPLPLTVESSPLPRSILRTFPTVGTVLRMSVDHGETRLGISFIQSNRWVKIINIRCEAHDGLWRAVLTPLSKICYLPRGDKTALQRRRSHEERVASKLGRTPMESYPWPSLVTETDYPDVPFVTLMDALTHSEVMGRFKCFVRVLALAPWRAEDLLTREGIYRVRLTLEDPTARIHAFLYKEEGDRFFGDSVSVDELTEKRDRLLGNDGAASSENDGRKSPWIQCCLESYFVDADDVWGSRKFRIFGTTLH